MWVWQIVQWGIRTMLVGVLLSAAILAESATVAVMCWIAAALAIVGFGADVMAGKRRLERERNSWIEEWSRLMQLRRHDWMNDIQVLYGYVKLNRKDYILGCMEKINAKLHEESALGKLGSPSLELTILSFKTESPQLEMNFYIDREVDLNGHPALAAVCDRIIGTVLRCFGEASAKSDAGMKAHLEILWKSLDGGMEITFVYEGNLPMDKPDAMLASDLKPWNGTVVSRTDEEEKEMEVTVSLPFTTLREG